jgi:hypothetical protein
MKNLHALVALGLLVAGTASAGETGIINQAGPYEAQMRFYLHPAHGFPGTPPETSAQSASTVVSKAASGSLLADARQAGRSSTSAVRQPTHHRSHRVTTAEGR